MDITLIITIVTYVLFFLGLLSGFLWGLKRGVKKSAIRLGTLVVFMIIAGLITAPISGALLKIDLSGFNLSVDGEMVTTIPETLKNLVLSNAQIADAAAEMPALMSIIEALPVAIMNIVVFFLLVFIMQFLSWIVFIILAKTALKEARLARQQKKQKKLEAKNVEKGQLIKPGAPSVALAPKPKKYRWWGGAVGTVQGFVLLFLLFLPLTSLTTTISTIAHTDAETGIISSSELVVHAEDEKFLSETSADLLNYYVGEDIISYIDAFSGAVSTKILTIGGFDDVIFDAITSVPVNDENFAFRKDILDATKIYDEVVLFLDEFGSLPNYTQLNFNRVEKVVNLIFNMGLFKSLAEEAIPYGLTFFYDSDTYLEFPYNSEVKDTLDAMVADLKTSPEGFVKTLKSDIMSLVKVGSAATKSGLVDEVLASEISYENIISAIKKDNYALLSSISNNLFNSRSLQILIGNASNIGLAEAGNKIRSDSSVDLGEIDYNNINWNNFKTNFYDLVKTGLDIYDILEPYGIQDIISNPKMLVENSFGNNDLKSTIRLVGKELNLVKTSPLFAGQTTIKTCDVLIDQISSLDKVSDFIDTTTLKTINLEIELNILSTPIVQLKESGLLSYVLNQTVDINHICELLLAKPADSDDTYVRTILTPLLNSSLSQKPIKHAFELANQNIETLRNALGEQVVEIDLTNFTALTNAEKDSVVNIAENTANFITSVGYQGFKDDLVATIFSLNDETIENSSALKISYAKNILTNLETIDILYETYLSVFDGLSQNEQYNKYVDFGAVGQPGFSWENEFNCIVSFLDILETEIEGSISKEILFPTNSISDLNLDNSTMNAILDQLLLTYPDTTPERTSIGMMVDNIYTSRLLKQSLVFVLNTLNTKVSDIISTETDPVTLTDIELEQLTNDQKEDVVSVIEDLGKCFSILTDSSFNLETLTDGQIIKVGDFLNALRYNAYDCDSTGTPNILCVLTTDEKSVENGGIFAELYIALVNYSKQSFEFTSDVSYGTIEWVNFLRTAKKLSDIANGGGDILDLLSDPNSGVDVGEVLEVIGVEEEIADKINDIQDSFSNISPTSAESYEDLSNSLGALTGEDLISITETINNIAGTEVPTDIISTDTLSKEQAVSLRISILMSNIDMLTGIPLGITDTNLIESLTDLCNGATYVLAQATSNGTVLDCTITGGKVALATEIDNATSNLTVRQLVKTLFGIEG